VLDCVNASSMKRWSMFTLWVTDPVLTMVTRRMFGLSDTTEKLPPRSIVAGALEMTGRGRKAPLAS